MATISRYLLPSIVLAMSLSAVGLVQGQDAAKGEKIELAGGKILLTLPADWNSVPPKSQIVEYEFVAPKSEAKAERQARATVMQAGGGIQANIDRWIGQFDQPDKSATKDKSKVEKLQVAGQTVHLVDISGNFKDSSGGGPFFQPKAPVVRENYRMLGAIIETQNLGQYFLKLTGPKDVMEKQAAAFKSMLQAMEIK